MKKEELLTSNDKLTIIIQGCDKEKIMWQDRTNEEIVMKFLTLSMLGK